jgi:hypothetical protein
MVFSPRVSKLLGKWVFLFGLKFEGGAYGLSRASAGALEAGPGRRGGDGYCRTTRLSLKGGSLSLIVK